MQYALPKHLQTSEEAGVITDWYEDELSSAGQAEFDRVLRSLVRLPLAEWTRPLYGTLKKEQERFGEIRFVADKKQYRPMGIVVPRQYRENDDVEEFVIVAGASKKMNIWTPKAAIDTAVNRIADIRKNGRRNFRDYTSHLEI